MITGFDEGEVHYQHKNQVAEKSEQHISATQKLQDFIRNFRKDGTYIYR
jgi:hypothetical protein